MDGTNDSDPSKRKARPAPPPPPPKKPLKDTNRSTVPIDLAINSVLESNQNRAEEPLLEMPSSNPFSHDENVTNTPTNYERKDTDETFSYANPSYQSNPPSSIPPNIIPVPKPVKTVPVPIPVPLPPSLHSKQSGESLTRISLLNPVQDRPTESISRSTHIFEKTQRRLGPADPNNKIYHLNQFSDVWWFFFLILHLAQFSILLSAGFDGLPPPAFAVLLILMIAVLVLVIIARCYVRKSKLSTRKNLLLKGDVCTPADESDEVPDKAIYLVTIACIFEGLLYAIYTGVLAGKHEGLSKPGYYDQDTILQTLRFSSIILLAMHRIFRPANRADPMGTILEVFIFIFYKYYI
jgi:hypothetical protein